MLLSSDHAALKAEADRLKTVSIASLLEQDPGRVDALSLSAAGLQLDASKQLVDDSALRTLASAASGADLQGKYSQLISGAQVNITEERAALHTLLRGTAAEALPELTEVVNKTLQRMSDATHAVHSGAHTGATGKPFTDVINIGIGGSDLGPRMVCRALDSATPNLHTHFISNVDPHDLDVVTRGLNPETTLLIVCSKTFTTEETLTNAQRAKQWLLNGGVPEARIGQHVFAVTTNLTAAAAFGISADACFPMWDWVGGRYSVWSAIGLVIALGYGWSAFTGLLAGANALDEHAREVDPLKNLPMLMALLELWNTRYLGVETHVVLPYSQRLEHLSDFLQQLTMESNGKRVTLTGEEITEATAPVLWGSAGTIGQHSYYQLLHQGNRRFTADIVLPLTNGDVNLDAHRKLAANALAQSRAFLIGRTADESTELARAKGLPPQLAPHFQMPGNHPHNTLVMKAVSAETVGAMIATYEHKTYFLSALMGLNAFDQWGVELGKAIGKQIRATLENATGLDDLDASTAALAAAWLDANH
ncbi:glucose-6-phosphate isomerase [Luminiphilus sp.]|nr:glucose-6-phosphate isomerase [Luminiphilus sp.]